MNFWGWVKTKLISNRFPIGGATVVYERRLAGVMKKSHHCFYQGGTGRTGSRWIIMVISWNLMRTKSQFSFHNSFHKTVWYYQRKPSNYLGKIYTFSWKIIKLFQGQFEVKYAVDQDSKTKKATYSHKLEIKSDHTQVHYGLKLLETLRWPSGYGNCTNY